MRFLLDEDVARCLQQAGHEVLLVTEVLGARAEDEEIWSHAVGTGSIVVNCNRQDFLQLAGAPVYVVSLLPQAP